jgi:hypothetical protein
MFPQKQTRGASKNKSHVRQKDGSPHECLMGRDGGQSREHREVPKEEAAAKPSRITKKRHRGWHLAAERRREPKELPRWDFGSGRNLAAACKKASRRTAVARRKGYFFRKIRKIGDPGVNWPPPEWGWTTVQKLHDAENTGFEIGKRRHGTAAGCGRWETGQCGGVGTLWSEKTRIGRCGGVDPLRNGRRTC